MIRTKHPASILIESSAIIPRNDSLGKYLLTEPVNRNTMSPVNEYGIFRRPRRDDVFSFSGRTMAKGRLLTFCWGGCSKVDGAARERLLIFGTEADSEVLQ